MNREKVDEMLKSYRFDVGRCGHLETEIKMLEKELDRCRKMLAEDLSGPQSPQLTGMPHGTMVSSPTERIGIMLASGWEPDYIKDTEKQLEECKHEYSERSFTVLFVRSWLNGLTDEESWIVEKQVIDGLYWKDVLTRFSIEFSKETSKDTLKRLKSRAMEKVYRMAE